MSKSMAVKGHHGLGARGQGKLLYFHTQLAHAIRQSKEQLDRKRQRPHEFRQPDGHWAP
ncbi:hypothetical protein [Streptacidiphilus fuscans]|uniref:Uncharacterized protein n=1 Tax=Streptacidiphilus fuscans TaxID=2789292 RepID=A0A931B728_9ACTN|nr:hypothetical protein [Streptacidiphilus fuscans]MBF9069852.1 hypothetical protein [Streptacidiphilus fuscans]MBF9073474.1 hypothetical protein [Streptacidiphilus fuscans]